LRNIYKTGEKSVREKEDEARIMKKIEQASPSPYCYPKAFDRD
jgi:hypothetical protein